VAEAGNNSRHLQRWVHVVLLGGVILSGVVLAAGLGLVLVTHQPRPEGVPPTVGQLHWSAVHADGVATLYVGLLLLMLTPLVRVAALAVGWLLGGDRRFALAAAVVLALLVLSLWLGVG
jgi:uncharacterized membrane protein